jgi:hypothetical protein
MMFKCISGFDIKHAEEDEDSPMDLTPEEKYAAAEKKEALIAQFRPDPISDDEEEDDIEQPLRQVQSPPAIQIRSQRSLGKRRRSTVSEPDGSAADEVGEEANSEAEGCDDDGDLPLAGSSTQQRVSRRVRKRVRTGDDAFDYY